MQAHCKKPVEEACHPQKLKPQDRIRSGEQTADYIAEGGAGTELTIRENRNLLKKQENTDPNPACYLKKS